MTAEEFVNEVQNSNQYYKEFEKEYKNFQIYQKKVAHTLQILHTMCEENEIHYQLDHYLAQLEMMDKFLGIMMWI